MFNKKRLEKLERKLNNTIEDFQRRLWAIENPPKYSVKDRVIIELRDGLEIIETNKGIIVKTEPYTGYFGEYLWSYTVFKDNGNMNSYLERYLKKEIL